jgi:hypothetical protein
LEIRECLKTLYIEGLRRAASVVCNDAAEKHSELPDLLVIDPQRYRRNSVVG